MKKECVVMASGVFDLIHPGHIFYLEEAKKLGSELVVVVANDEVAKQKGPILFSAEQRRKMVSALKAVDKAIVSDNYRREEFYKIVLEINPDIIALGYDQKFDQIELARELSDHGWEGSIVRIRKYPNGEISSSKIKNYLRSKDEV